METLKKRFEEEAYTWVTNSACASPGKRARAEKAYQFISCEVQRLELYSSICLIFKKVILIKHELFQSYSATPLHVGFFALGLQKNESICVKKNDMNFAN